MTTDVNAVAGSVSDFANVMAVVQAAMDDIWLAEEEIKRAQMEHPESADLIHACFLPLQRPGILCCKDSLYRWHIRELLDRVAEGKALDLPTRAEMLAALSEASLVIPLSHDATAVACALWSAFVEEMGVTAPEMLQDCEMEKSNPETDIVVMQAATKVLRKDQSYDARREFTATYHLRRR